MDTHSDDDSGCFAPNRKYINMLDRIGDDAMMSVYCECGKIVNLDRSEMRVRLALGKELECMKCRNVRISNEIDEINNHFLGIEEDEDSRWGSTILRI